MSALRMNMETWVVIDGLPTVPAAKRAMFEALLTKKITEQLGTNQFTLSLVTGEDGNVNGAFLDCRSTAAADRAVAKLNKYHFTKTDVFKVNRWTDFAEAQATPDDYEPIGDDELEQTSTVEATNPLMTDRLARPQILVKAGDNYDINWSYVFTATGKIEPVKPARDLEQWAVLDRKAKKLQAGVPQPLPMWSPQGTYVITQDKGVLKLWGGKSTVLLVEFPAPELRFVQMSPNEKYLVTYGREYQFWDVSTSKLIATIPGDAPYWPVFKYNADDSLCATFTRDKGTIMVFKAETMELQVQALPPRFTLQEDGMSAFAWSPTDPEIFAYAVSGDDNIGFRVQIDRIQLLPDRDELTNMCVVRQLARRNYFGVKSIDLLWHPLGNYLASKITKANDTMQYGVFRVSSNMASAEALEVKGDPLRFAWQPNGHRFGIIMAESKTQKQRVCFYEMQKPGFKDVGSFMSGGVRLFWAPKGTRCVSVNYTTSRLEFYGVQGCGPFPSDQKMSLIISAEHPMVTDAEWDPTGRFFCSWVSSHKQQMDNAWMVWNVNGQKVFEQKISRLSHCTWRPLAPSLLGADDLQKIKRELPQRAAKYKEETLALQRKQDEAASERKKAAMEKYKRIMDQIHAYVDRQELDEQRAALIAKSPSIKKQVELLKKEAPIAEEKEVEE